MAITAMERDLLEQDPDKVSEITAALERLVAGEESAADTALFAMFKVVSIGIAPDLLVAIKIGR